MAEPWMVASHALRTPLTALSLEIQELDLLADDPEEVHRFARRALSLVDDLEATTSELCRSLACRGRP